MKLPGLEHLQPLLTRGVEALERLAFAQEEANVIARERFDFDWEEAKKK